MDWPVVYRRKVRFSDSDAQGIVFNANYLTYFDDTITDYFDALGIPWSEFTARGFEMVLAHVELDFRSPGRIGDELVTGARVTAFGRASVTCELRTWDAADDRTVVEGREVQVFVDAESFRPVPVPRLFLDAVAELQGGLPAQAETSDSSVELGTRPEG